MPQRYRFKKRQRLCRNEDFRRVLSRRRTTGNATFRLYIARNGTGLSRFGVSVSRSCGGAVRRNRIKRLAREVFRLYQHEIPSGYDYLLIFSSKSPKKKQTRRRDALPAIGFAELERTFLSYVERLTRQDSGLDRDE